MARIIGKTTLVNVWYSIWVELERLLVDRDMSLNQFLMGAAYRVIRGDIKLDYIFDAYGEADSYDKKCTIKPNHKKILENIEIEQVGVRHIDDIGEGIKLDDSEFEHKLLKENVEQWSKS